MNLYFVALVLPEEINEQVLHYKNLMKQNYGCIVALRSPAHVTLLPPFRATSGMEELLKDCLKRAADMGSFNLRTNNFSAFIPRTIFIDVYHSDCLNKLKSSVERSFGNEASLALKPDNRPFHPHITVATRDLAKKQFYEAWPSFQGQKFEVSWQVNDLSILKHNGRSWDVWHTISLDNAS